MDFTDSHAHLDDEKFVGDREAVLSRARAAGVERILAIGNGKEPVDFQETLALAEKTDFVWAALGIHPHDACHANAGLLAELERLASAPKVVAWGEIGLDYHFDHSPRPVQQEFFRRQLESARRLNLPVVIHCREAWEDCLRILEEQWAPGKLGGILHCFSGTLAQARQALEWGFLISFAGNVTFPRAENLRATAQALPLDGLLVETDAPYLAPQSVRGRRNEPAHVLETAAALGRLHGVSREEMGKRTTENFLRLFPRAARN